MTDPRRPSRFNPPGQGFDQTRPRQNVYQPRTHPAYSGQLPSTPSYGAGADPRPDSTGLNPTDRLPTYWLQGQTSPQWQQGGRPGDEAPGRESSGAGRSKPPRWLWIVAGAAVLLVVALVIALVIANGSAKKGTAVPPLPAMPGSTKNPPSTTATPSSSALPTTTSPAPSTTVQTTSAVASETVVYTVTGEGRAISISYLDDDGVRQIEFNVALPWSKQVSVPRSSKERAGITIVNIGHDVTCSVTVDGVAGPQRTGVGLTMCEGAT